MEGSGCNRVWTTEMPGVAGWMEVYTGAHKQESTAVESLQWTLEMANHAPQPRRALVGVARQAY